MNRFRPFMNRLMRILLGIVSSSSASSNIPSVCRTRPLSSTDIKFETGLDQVRVSAR